jgi:putative ABC transport system permease protein
LGFEEVVRRVAAVPGVRAASGITWLPLAGAGSATIFWVNDRPVPEPGDMPVADIRPVQSDYLSVMGIPLLEGRFFDSRDVEDAPMTVVVNRTMARKFWPDGSAVGKSLSMPWNDLKVAEIIGVVGDVRHGGPAEDPRSTLYWHYPQFHPFGLMSIVARTDGSPAELIPAIRRAVAEFDPSVPVYNAKPMKSYLSDTLARARFSTIALALFGVLAITLAVTGVYGVMSYSVSRRTREFGIRIALGADSGRLLKGVVWQGAVIIVPAVVLGGVVAVLSARVLEGMVFEVSTHDPIAVLGAGMLLTAVGLIACLVPARRAGSVDPLESLRIE